jgi:hypothetical protein
MIRFYFAHRRGEARIPAAEVIAAIQAQGRWTRHEEWRISTVTTTEISRTDEPQRYRKYRVRVECDFVLEAYCPTITRAIEIAERYEILVEELWHSMGWPSWASRGQLEPPADAV